MLERCAKRMQDELDLTEDQQASVDKIVRAHQPQLDLIRARTIDECAPNSNKSLKRTAAVLTARTQHSSFAPTRSRASTNIFRPTANRSAQKPDPIEFHRTNRPAAHFAAIKTNTRPLQS